MATEVAVRPRETLSVEQNGINVISDAERKGRPRDLFWPWCAANIAVLGISYGSFLLGFGVSFWQATVAGLIGTILSFLLVGFVSLAGKQDDVAGLRDPDRLGDRFAPAGNLGRAGRASHDIGTDAGRILTPWIVVGDDHNIG